MQGPNERGVGSGIGKHYYIGAKAIAMVILFLWVVFSLIVGSAGKNKRIGFGAAFACSLLLSPLIGMIAVALSKDLAEESQQQQALELQQQQAASLAAIQQAGGASVADELQKLLQLKEAGHLSEAEYEAQRAKLLA